MTDSADFSLTVTDSPDADLLAQLRQLATAGVASDANEPFSDQTWVELRQGHAHIAVARERDTEQALLGAAVLIPAQDADSAHLLEAIVDEPHRGKGIGTRLVDEVLREVTGGQLTAWSHGDHPAARALATRHELEPVRELWRMALPADRVGEDVLTAQAPDGYRFRTFDPAQDGPAWLALNATAFADHPEQGQLTQSDLDARQADDWFDADGFFLAETATESPQLRGFHWTKVPVVDPGSDTIGEVYAVGVDPAAQGSGLGRALTSYGMAHLVRDRQVAKIVLYVDEENTAATTLYKSLGFDIENVDVMFSTP